MSKTPDAIPGAFQVPATDRAVFGSSGPHRPLAVVQKAFLKELEGLSRYNSPADVLRNWASWWAYMIAADVANTPASDEDKLDAAQKAHLTQWRKELAECRDNMKSVLESYGPGWQERSADMMEILGEGLEAANGDFLSTVLEAGLGGTLKGAGQFFTPPPVCRMMGKMVMGTMADVKKRFGWVEEICEPCCGAGAIPIAAVGEFLDAGGRREDVCVEVGDIDAGALCMCYIQMVALMIPGRAQVKDALRNEARGPMMLTPAYVLFQTGRRLAMQRAVEAMDEVLRGGNPKASADEVTDRIPLPGRRPARGPTRASGGGGATTPPQVAEEGLHGAPAGRNGATGVTEGEETGASVERKAVPVQGTLF